MSGGIVAVSQRALSDALRSDLEAAAGEVAFLSDGQLNRLILACHQLADAAAAELNGRQA
jgi:hypothetical protein